MSKIVIKLSPHVKRQIRKRKRKSKDAGVVLRCQIILAAAKGKTRREIASTLDCSVSWVNRVIARFLAHGLAGLEDRREDNGEVKLDDDYLALLYTLVDGSPQQHGFPRPTWTRELLAKVMFLKTGVSVNVGTMSRALQLIGARLGRPKPTVGCPWPKHRKNRRLRKIRQMLEGLPADEVAVYLDEVDIHLNPKIGPDWMNRGKQKTVLTPGSNVKRYLCGTLDAKTGVLTWVKAERKNSILFAYMMHKLVEAYPQAKVIHVVLDNCKIHHSAASRAVVESLQGKIKLHWLPPYCPDHNKIERVWLDLHANVTRNHTHREMDDLMAAVIRWLKARNCQARADMRKAA